MFKIMNTNVYWYVQAVSNKSAITVRDYYKQGVDLWSIFKATDAVQTLTETWAGLTTLECVAIVFFTLLILRYLYIVLFWKSENPKKPNDDANLLPMLCDMAKTAFTSGQTDKVIYLVETHGIDVNMSLPYNRLNLFLCSCLSGNKRLVQYMLSKGGDVKRTTSAGDSSLYLATFSVINYGQPDCFLLETILTAGCDVNKANNAGYTPLHRAAGGGHIQIIKLFLKYGANPLSCSTGGIYPLDIAINNGHLEAAELLKIRAYNPHLWDVIDPHTPPHIKLGLQSPKRNHLIESSRQFCSPKLKANR